MKPGYWRHLPSIFLLLAGGARGWAQGRSAAEPSQAIGFYHWGGQSPRSISEGIRAIAAMHGHVARIALSARYRMDYQDPAAKCEENFRLVDTLADPDLQAAFGTPGIDVIMITAYDGVSFRDCQTHSYLVPAFYTPENRAAIAGEYSEFVLGLFQRYAGSGKRFILSNWEGDNTIYCGQAWRYALESAFREMCNANYALYYAGNRSPAESIQGLIAWFRVRYQGVSDGQRRAAAAGLTGLLVELAPEFSVVRALRNGGFASVLYDVIPAVPFDYVSYSAYESIGPGGGGAQLASDLDVIRAVAGTSRIVIGEAGFARSVWGPQTVPHLEQTIHQAIAWGVPFVIVWNLFNQDQPCDFGLFDANAEATEVGEYFTRLLARQASSRNSLRP